MKTDTDKAFQFLYCLRQFSLLRRRYYCALQRIDMLQGILNIYSRQEI